MRSYTVAALTFICILFIVYHMNVRNMDETMLVDRDNPYTTSYLRNKIKGRVGGGRTPSINNIILDRDHSSSGDSESESKKEDIENQLQEKAKIEEEKTNHQRTIPPTTASPTTLSPTTASPTTPSPTAAPTNAQCKDKAKDIDEFIDQLKQKRHKYLVVQTDNRLHQVFHPEDISLKDQNKIIYHRNFSSNYVACSVLGVSNWARENGYGYLFVDSLIRYPDIPSAEKGPYGNQTLSGYWNKVPAVLEAFDIAKRSGIQYVFYIDSDISPNLGNEYNLTLDNLIQASNNSLVKINRTFDEIDLIITPDEHYWSSLLILYEIYGGTDRSGLNSGTFLFRISDKTQSLLQQWWFNETQYKTPYELSNYPLRYQFSAKITHKNGEEFPNKLNSSYNWNDILLNEKKNEFAQHDPLIIKEEKFVWDCCEKVNGVSTAKLSIGLLFRSTNDRYYPMMMNNCFRGLCDELIYGEMVMRTGNNSDLVIEIDKTETKFMRITDIKEIKAIFGNIGLTDTLTTWPGDQDRLNYLYFKNKDIIFRPWNRNQEDVIPSWCTTVLGEMRPRKMLLHWCDNDQMKGKFSKVLSAQLEKKLNKPGENWERYAWKVLNDTIFSTGYHGFGSSTFKIKQK